MKYLYSHLYKTFCYVWSWPHIAICLPLLLILFTGCGETEQAKKSTTTSTRPVLGDSVVTGLAQPLGSSRSLESEVWITKFDGLIKGNCIRYLGRAWDCLRFKAQIYQESGFKVDAVSHAGAMGLLQIMPGTWRDLEKQTNISSDPFNPVYSIQFGAIYTRQQYDQFTAERTIEDRKKLALAAYNAGLGTVLRAQQKAGGANDYASIVIFLPAETQDYNRKIVRWRDYMIRDGHVL